MLRLARGLSLRTIPRRFQSSEQVGDGLNVAASGSTGIEHALKFKQLGQRHKQDFKDYKCAEYLNFNKYSYYDSENSINPHRVPQPTNKKPDVEPKVKN